MSVFVRIQSRISNTSFHGMGISWCWRWLLREWSSNQWFSSWMGTCLRRSLPFVQEGESNLPHQLLPALFRFDYHPQHLRHPQLFGSSFPSCWPSFCWHLILLSQLYLRGCKGIWDTSQWSKHGSKGQPYHWPSLWARWKACLWSKLYGPLEWKAPSLFRIGTC